VSAVEALQAARAAGVDVEVDGNDLVLQAQAEPPSTVIDGLHRHKTEILALLRPVNSSWSADDWRACFNKRTQIAEIDSGLARPEAEAQAFGHCVVEWLNQSHVASPPGHCLVCGGIDRTLDPLLPYGTDANGHAWLHFGCWPAWHAGRKAEAVAALKVMGIVPPAKFPDDFGKNGGA